MIVTNPTNNYTKNYTNWLYLWSFLFGWMYFAAKGMWGMALAAFITFIIPPLWILYPVVIYFTKKRLKVKYLNKGWIVE